MKALRLLSIGIALLLIQACSHPIEIEGEGDVVSPEGDVYCTLEQEPCSNIVTGDYIRTYVGEPRSGWKFRHWEGCSTQHPNCSVNVPGAIVDQYWFQTMPPLKAVFCLDVDTDGDELLDCADPCPANPTNPCALITGADTVVEANGKQWAQPVLFTNLSWNQIDAVCSGGPCVGGSRILNGHDMTGWTWAGYGEVAALFNRYGVVPELSLEVPSFADDVGADSTWATALVGNDATQFRPTYVFDSSTYTTGSAVIGIVSEPPVYMGCYFCYPPYIAKVIDVETWIDGYGINKDTAGTGSRFPYEQMSSSWTDRGAWFYRLIPN